MVVVLWFVAAEQLQVLLTLSFSLSLSHKGSGVAVSIVTGDIVT